MNKVLVVGMGSIGKRHLNNLISLGCADISVVTSKRSEVLREYPTIHFYSSLQMAIATNSYKFVLICTPTAFHLQTLITLVENKVPHIYIEKPISNTVEQLEEVSSQIERNNCRVIVGYDLHFDPGLQKVKSLIYGHTIGKVISVNAQVGQYLPDWRPTEDYRHGMSAKIDSGGGVLLDLVHEFDYLYWLFGEVSQVVSFNGKMSELEIETEDVAEVLLRFSSGVVGTVHLDYLQRKLVRNCLITGGSGSIKWDLADNRVTWVDANKNNFEFCYSDFQRNDRFVEIIKSFLSCEPDPRLSKFSDGLESLKVASAAKESQRDSRIINLN